MQELWVTIPEAKGYEISSLGKIRNSNTGKVLKTWVNNSGYECIKLSAKSKPLNATIHRLVAKAFCEGYEEGKIVNHKDTNRLHNAASNLEWLTYEESIQEMKSRGALNTSKARKANRKNQLKRVDMYTKDGTKLIKTFDSIKEASAETGAGAPHITKVLKGNRYTAGGYHWKYNDPKDNYSYYRKGMR
ncbi:HNH homing endonuclease [Bacillus phage Mater]|uniref:HNH homing endonuclease n=1 Tax=Bacillus phage Mater TaxID=1540090 RepID=A0A0A0RUN2_9CAUD|nr:HNH homing endonuclease [Bacillus phage Mater]AIW03278.1 HNH homing endonuclease [Bacillus phage Mater]